MSQRLIKVLVVEDSKAARMLLVRILRSDAQLQVVGAAQDGFGAMQFLSHVSPDVILMDIQMPKMDGLEATRRIMESRPIPIVICSAGSNPREAATMFRSMEAGAVACVEKPVGLEHQDFEKVAAELIQTVKLMSEVKVVRRWPRTRTDAGRRPMPAPALKMEFASPIKLIGIGASTGGPAVLQNIFAALPSQFSVPILVVQHITRGFLPGLVHWLGQSTGMVVQVAEHETEPLPGHVYLAPDDFHMVVNSRRQIALTKAAPDGGVRPSVARLFDSLANIYGASAVGVILTGMGKDGARELLRLKECGSLTIAQDRETSVVHGMAGEAIAMGAATWILAADRIAPTLAVMVRQQSFSGEHHESVGSTA